jgi:TPP-dependent pyruvate/acetoin dehydrogenase alpha subunit
LLATGISGKISMLYQLPVVVCCVNIFIGMGSSRSEKLFKEFFHRRNVGKLHHR